MSIVTGIGTSSTTSVSAPADTKNNDVIILLLSKDGTPAFNSVDSSFTLLSEQSNSAVRVGVYYKVHDGLSKTILVNSPTNFTWICMNIGRATVVPQIAHAIGTTSTPTPPALTHTFGAGVEVLWIAAFGCDYGRSISAYPSNFPDNRASRNSGSSSSTSSGIATLSSINETENPNSFTISSSDQWVAFTIAVPRVPYKSSGSYLSNPIEIEPLGTSYITWTETKPENTSVVVKYGTTSDIFVEPSIWYTVEINAELEHLDNTFLVLKVELSTTDLTVTPSIASISIYDTYFGYVELTFSEANRFNNIEGNLTVIYNAGLGTLSGQRAVESFEYAFLPEGIQRSPSVVETMKTSLLIETIGLVVIYQMVAGNGPYTTTDERYIKDVTEGVQKGTIENETLKANITELVVDLINVGQIDP